MDLDFWDCFGISPPYNRRNTVAGLASVTTGSVSDKTFKVLNYQLTMKKCGSHNEMTGKSQRVVKI